MLSQAAPDQGLSLVDVSCRCRGRMLASVLASHHHLLSKAALPCNGSSAAGGWFCDAGRLLDILSMCCTGSEHQVCSSWLQHCYICFTPT